MTCISFGPGLSENIICENGCFEEKFHVSVCAQRETDLATYMVTNKVLLKSL